MEYREGNMIDGRYRLEQFIGSGSFGEVWVAVDTRTDLEVAIKIYISMDKHGLEEFTKEFQVSFDLNQTNLLHSNYLGVNAEDNRAYLIMPYCPEGSVTSLIMKRIGYVQGLEIGTQNDRTKFWEFALCTIVPTITGILRIVPKFLWPISRQKREWMYAELSEKRQQSIANYN